eukprot:Nk52_evm22s163 gene=Nk52_evmTU22s163
MDGMDSGANGEEASSVRDYRSRDGEVQGSTGGEVEVEWNGAREDDNEEGNGEAEGMGEAEGGSVDVKIVEIGEEESEERVVFESTDDTEEKREKKIKRIGMRNLWKRASRKVLPSSRSQTDIYAQKAKGENANVFETNNNDDPLVVLESDNLKSKENKKELEKRIGDVVDLYVGAKSHSLLREPGMRNEEKDWDVRIHGGDGVGGLLREGKKAFKWLHSVTIEGDDAGHVVHPSWKKMRRRLAACAYLLFIFCLYVSLVWLIYDLSQVKHTGEITVKGRGIHADFDECGVSVKHAPPEMGLDPDSVKFSYAFDRRLSFDEPEVSPAEPLLFSVRARGSFGDFVACTVVVYIPYDRSSQLNITLTFLDENVSALHIDLPPTLNPNSAVDSAFRSQFNIRGSIFQVSIASLALGREYIFQEFNTVLSEGTVDIGQLFIGSASDISKAALINIDTASGDVNILVASAAKLLLHFQIDRPLLCTPSLNWIDPHAYCERVRTAASTSMAYDSFQNCSGKIQSTFFSNVNDTQVPVDAWFTLTLFVHSGSVSINGKSGKTKYVDPSNELKELSVENENYEYESKVDPHLEGSINLAYEDIKESTYQNFLYSIRLVHFQNSFQSREGHLYQVSNIPSYISLPYAFVATFSFATYTGLLQTFHGRVYPAICNVPPIYNSTDVSEYTSALASHAISSSLPSGLGSPYVARFISLTDITRFLTYRGPTFNFIQYRTQELSQNELPTLYLALAFSFFVAILGSSLLMWILLTIFYNYCEGMVMDKDRADKFNYVHKHRQGLYKEKFHSAYELKKHRNLLTFALKVPLSIPVLVELIYLEARRYWLSSINAFVNKHCTLVNDSLGSIGKRSTPTGSFFLAHMYFCARNRIPRESINYMLKHLEQRHVYLKPSYEAGKTETYRGIGINAKNSTNTTSMSNEFPELSYEGSLGRFLTEYYTLTGSLDDQVSVNEFHDAYSKYCQKHHLVQMKLTDEMLITLHCPRIQTNEYVLENILLNRTTFSDRIGTYKKKISVPMQLGLIIIQFILVALTPIPALSIVDFLSTHAARSQEETNAMKPGLSYIMSDENTDSFAYARIPLDISMFFFFCVGFIEAIFHNVIEYGETSKAFYFDSDVLNAFQKVDISRQKNSFWHRFRKVNQALYSFGFLGYCWLYFAILVMYIQWIFLEVYVTPSTFLPIATAIVTLASYCIKKNNAMQQDASKLKAYCVEQIGFYIDSMQKANRPKEGVDSDGSQLVEKALKERMETLSNTGFLGTPQMSVKLQKMAEGYQESIAEFLSSKKQDRSVWKFFLSLLLSDVGSTFQSITDLFRGASSTDAFVERLNAFVLLCWYTELPEALNVFANVHKYLLQWEDSLLSKQQIVERERIIYRLLESLHAGYSDSLWHFISRIYHSSAFLGVPTQYLSVYFKGRSCRILNASGKSPARYSRSAFVSDLILLNTLHSVTGSEAEKKIVCILFHPLKSSLGELNEFEEASLGLSANFFSCLSGVFLQHIVEMKTAMKIINVDLGITTTSLDTLEDETVKPMVILEALQHIAKPISFASVISHYCDYALAREIAVFINAVLFKQASGIAAMRLSHLAKSFNCPPSSIKAILYLFADRYAMAIEQMTTFISGVDRKRANNVACSLLRISTSENISVVQYALLNVREEMSVNFFTPSSNINSNAKVALFNAKQLAHGVIEFQKCISSCCNLWEGVQASSKPEECYKAAIRRAIKGFSTFLDQLGAFLLLHAISNSTPVIRYNCLSLFVPDEGILKILIPEEQHSTGTPDMFWSNLGQVFFGDSFSGKALMCSAIFLSPFSTFSSQRLFTLTEYANYLRADKDFILTMYSLRMHILSVGINDEVIKECSSIFETKLDFSYKRSFRKMLLRVSKNNLTSENSMSMLCNSLGISWETLGPLLCDSEAKGSVSYLTIRKSFDLLFEKESPLRAIKNIGIDGQTSPFSVISSAFHEMFPQNHSLSRVFVSLSPFIFKQLEFLQRNMDNKIIADIWHQNCHLKKSDFQLLTSLLNVVEFCNALQTRRLTRGRSKGLLATELKHKNISYSIAKLAQILNVNHSIVKCACAIHYDNIVLYQVFLQEAAESFGMHTEKAKLLIHISTGDIKDIGDPLHLLGVPSEAVSAIFAISNGRYSSIQTSLSLLGNVLSLSKKEQSIIADTLSAYHHQKSDFTFFSSFFGMKSSFVCGLSQLFYTANHVFCYRYPSQLAAGLQFASDVGFGNLMDFVSGHGSAMAAYLLQRGYPSHLFRVSQFLLKSRRRTGAFASLTMDDFNALALVVHPDFVGLPRLLGEIYCAGRAAAMNMENMLVSPSRYFTAFSKMTNIGQKELFYLFEFCAANFSKGIPHCLRSFKDAFSETCLKSIEHEGQLIKLLCLIYSLARTDDCRCFMSLCELSNFGTLCCEILKCCDFVYRLQFIELQSRECDIEDFMTLIDISQGYLGSVETNRVEFLADIFCTCREGLLTLMSLLSFQVAEDKRCLLVWVEHFFDSYGVTLSVGIGFLSLLNLKYCSIEQQKELINRVCESICSKTSLSYTVLKHILLVARNDFSQSVEFFASLHVPEGIGRALRVSSIIDEERRRGQFEEFISYNRIRNLIKPLYDALNIPERMAILLVGACSGNLEAFTNFVCFPLEDSKGSTLEPSKAIFLLSIATDSDLLLHTSANYRSPFLSPSNVAKHVNSHEVDTGFDIHGLHKYTHKGETSHPILETVLSDICGDEEKKRCLLALVAVICNWYRGDLSKFVSSLLSKLYRVDQEAKPVPASDFGDMVDIFSAILSTKRPGKVCISCEKMRSFFKHTGLQRENSLKTVTSLVAAIVTPTKARICSLFQAEMPEKPFGKIRGFLCGQFDFKRGEPLVTSLFKNLSLPSTNVLLSFIYRRMSQFLLCLDDPELKLPQTTRSKLDLIKLLLRWYVQESPLSTSEMKRLASNLANIYTRNAKDQLEVGGNSTLVASITSLMSIYIMKFESLVEYFKLDTTKHGDKEGILILQEITEISPCGNRASSNLMLKISNLAGLTADSAGALISSIKAKSIGRGSMERESCLTVIKAAQRWLKINSDQMEAFFALSAKKYSSAYSLLTNNDLSASDGDGIQDTLCSLDFVIKTRQGYIELKKSIHHLQLRAKQGPVEEQVTGLQLAEQSEVLGKAFSKFSSGNVLTLDGFRDAYAFMELPLNKSQSYLLYIRSLNDNLKCDYEGFVSSFKKFKANVAVYIMKEHKVDVMSVFKMELKWLSFLIAWLCFIVLGALAFNNQKEISAVFFSVSALVGGISGFSLSSNSSKELLKDPFYIEKVIKRAIYIEQGWIGTGLDYPKADSGGQVAC